MFRKMFLGKAWALVMFAAMALLTGVIFVSHLPTVSAASQNNLASFTDLRYGMFIHFNMGIGMILQTTCSGRSLIWGLAIIRLLTGPMVKRLMVAEVWQPVQI